VELSESPPEPRARRALVVVLRVERLSADLDEDLGAGLAALLVVLLAGLAEAFPVALLDLVDREVVVGGVGVVGGVPLVPRPPIAEPTSRLTWRVRSSIRLVSRSTSVWLAVRFTRLWTCCRLAWIAFCPCVRLRSSCREMSGGSRFCRSLTALPAALRAWFTRLPSPGFRLDARLRGGI
jgi:hypothetical protein